MDWRSPHAPHAHRYLVQTVRRLLIVHAPTGRILDLGCGNGALCGVLAAQGYDVVGIDGSAEAIALARSTYPSLTFYCRPLVRLTDLGIFDAVVSTEVIEHLLLPRELLRAAASALTPAGPLILSTPYHGYLKNLALSLLDGWDRHFAVAWDGGHVKFFSRRSLDDLLRECGFTPWEWHGVGRVPWLWKSMIVVAHRTPH